MFAVPAKFAVTAVVVFPERVNPPISKVFPAPLAVIVLPEVVVLFIFREPIVNLVPVPAKVTPLLVVVVTVPFPRLRLLEEVLPAVPKVKSPPQVTRLFPAFTRAVPLVLLIVPAVSVTAPEPRALALLIFRVPAVRVTPPAAPELSPLKVNVPPAAFIVVSPSYVLLPEKVVVPVPVMVTPPAVAVPPFPITPTFQLPAPARVKVRLTELPEDVRLRPPLKAVVAPVAVVQVPLDELC